MRETGLPRTGRDSELQGRQCRVMRELRSLVFALVLLSGFRQGLDEWRIGVQLGA